VTSDGSKAGDGFGREDARRVGEELAETAVADFRLAPMRRIEVSNLRTHNGVLPEKRLGTIIDADLALTKCARQRFSSSRRGCHSPPNE
jgi:hypothetical protein